MDIYKQAVWNELKNTTEEFVRLLELSQHHGTEHMVEKGQLDRLRYKINGLISQLDEKAA